MPGRRLNDEERRLIQFWSEPPSSFDQPLLKTIAIDGPPALRGIEHLRVPFDYPITAVCGKNGVGKSTILALAAFSSNRPGDWSVPPWLTHPRRKQARISSYAWPDFFFRRPDDPEFNGITIRYAFSHKGNDIEVERRLNNGRWRTVPDPGRSVRYNLPRRPIEFLSLSRILPPAELQHVRTQFHKAEKTKQFNLNQDLVDAMSVIFGKAYSSIVVEEKNGASLAACVSTEGYNGFNMGAGEHAVISILSAHQRLPMGGLLIVEEIENGLHPEAQLSLVEELTKLIHKKRQQIIFTTHSNFIIDRLPRQGRILLDRVGKEHRMVSAPTARFAMANMAGRANPEATLYVEDRFSEALVTACLPPNIRQRVDVVSIGDSVQVAAQLGAHIRGGYPGPAKCIFDGDCLIRDIRNWLKKENLNDVDTRYLLLPGEKAPERWVLEELKDNKYISNFANRLELDIAETRSEIDRMLVLSDHHDVPYYLANILSKSTDAVTADLISPLASKHPALDEVRLEVSKMLVT